MPDDDTKKQTPEVQEQTAAEPDNETGEISLEDAEKVSGGTTFDPLDVPP